VYFEITNDFGIECSWLENDEAGGLLAKTERSEESQDVAMKDKSAPGIEGSSFPLPLPLERCVEVLRRIALSQNLDPLEDTSTPKL
jgi:hypothetical protein